MDIVLIILINLFFLGVWSFLIYLKINNVYLILRGIILGVFCGLSLGIFYSLNSELSSFFMGNLLLFFEEGFKLMFIFIPLFLVGWKSDYYEFKYFAASLGLGFGFFENYYRIFFGLWEGISTEYLVKILILRGIFVLVPIGLGFFISKGLWDYYNEKKLNSLLSRYLSTVILRSLSDMILSFIVRQTIIYLI